MSRLATIALLVAMWSWLGCCARLIWLDRRSRG